MRAGAQSCETYERHSREERQCTLGLTNFIRGDLISRRQDALRRGHPRRAAPLYNTARFPVVNAPAGIASPRCKSWRILTRDVTRSRRETLSPILCFSLSSLAQLNSPKTRSIRPRLDSQWDFRRNVSA